MDYNIDTISIKRFLFIWILWLLAFIILFIHWNIIAHIKINGIFFVAGFIVVFITGLAIALRFSKRVPKLLLTENSLEFDNCTINLIDIEGYYINRESPLMTEVEFRDKNQDYKITSVNYGKKGKEFELFLTDFVEKSFKANKNIKELSFYDFHDKQYIIVKNTIYFTFIIVILLNIMYCYLVLVKKITFNWKLLFLNLIMIWLYDLHRRNKKNKEKY
jgi:hypothetical protein